MASDMDTVLFICTRSSARSTFAEGLINRWGAGTFRGRDAGSRPRGGRHPLALCTTLNLPAESN
jgi:protein-tyrosine-phosphatase